MRVVQKKSNKIPRVRLPSLDKRQTSYEPKMKFFQKIKNSLHLLEKTNVENE